MTDFLQDESLIAPPRTVRIDFDDGSFALRSPMALKPYARCIGEWIERWASETPDALAFAERDESGEGWRKLDYRGREEVLSLLRDFNWIESIDDRKGRVNPRVRPVFEERRAVEEASKRQSQEAIHWLSEKRRKM